MWTCLLKKQPPEVFFKKRRLWFFFIKKETLTQVFSCEFCEISKNSFLTEHLKATASASALILYMTLC